MPSFAETSDGADRIGIYRRQILGRVLASPQWQELTANERRYARAMVMQHANPDKGGAMFPSHLTLANKFPTARKGATASRSGRQSRRTAIRVLKSLVEKQVFEMSRGEGGRAVNTYRVHRSILVTAVLTGQPPRQQDVTRDVTADVTQKLRSEALQGSFAFDADAVVVGRAEIDKQKLNQEQQAALVELRALVDSLDCANEQTLTGWWREYGHFPAAVFWWVRQQVWKQKQTDVIENDAGYACACLQSLDAYEFDLRYATNAIRGPNPSFATITESYEEALAEYQDAIEMMAEVA